MKFRTVQQKHTIEVLGKVFTILTLCFAGTGFGQTVFFPAIAVEVGGVMSGESNPDGLGNEGYKDFGMAYRIEPTILSFGSKQQYDFNFGVSYSQNGGTETVSIVPPPSTGWIVVGSEAVPVKINYFSFSPNIKYHFLKFLYIKAGVRADIFTGYSATYSPPPLNLQPFYTVQTITSNDFSPVIPGP